jgi:hypothetical protein
VNEVLTTESFDAYRYAHGASDSSSGRMIHYPLSQLRPVDDGSGSLKLVVPDHREHINTSTMAFNKNLISLGYSTIEPMGVHPISVIVNVI